MHIGVAIDSADGLFVASLALVPFIPATFIPQSDLGRSNLSLELPPGTRLQDTVAVAERARALLKDMPELKQVYTAVGSVLDLGDPGATGIGEPRKATLVLDWGNADGRAEPDPWRSGWGFPSCSPGVPRRRHMPHRRCLLNPFPFTPPAACARC